MRRVGVVGVCTLLWFASAMVASGTAQAVPASPDLYPLTQPNGVRFEARGFGDEWNNGIEVGGYTVMQNRGTGYWEYAVAGNNGTLHPGGRRVGIDNPGALHKHLRPETIEAAPAAPDLSSPNIGTQRSLVILVSFTDQTSQSTPESWSDAFFGPSGSVTDFYRTVSYGQLTIAPAAETSGTPDDGVVGWLALDRTHPNTGSTTGKANLTLTKDAVTAADPFVDFASYDTDLSGSIGPAELHITVIPAGYEASYGAIPAGGKSVWGHRWCIGVNSGVTPPTVDGVSIGGCPGGGYTQFGEMHGATHQATIGIMVHELGHDLSLPDLYDTSSANGGSQGVGVWSIMGSGSWLAVPGQWAGATPSIPDPFSRIYEGWVTPTQVQGTLAAASIPQAEAADPSLSIVQLLDNPNGVDWSFNKTSGTGEYFLVENRQRTGYDAGLPGCGLLIWHIDETRTSSNLANADETRKLVDLEEADGLAQLDAQVNRGDAGDPFPGASANRMFGAATNPNSALYSGTGSGVSVTNIGDCASTMTADLSTEEVVPPANDAFASATVLSGPTATRTGDTNLGATLEAGEPSIAGDAGGHSVWYRWAAPAAGSVTFDTVGSDVDTLLGAYTGSSVGGLTPVAENDDSGGTPQSQVTFAAQAGLVYRIAVDGLLGATGTVNLHVVQQAPAPCTITGTSATETLTGTPGDDVICGLGGADVIKGLGGNDTLLGGDGGDRIRPGLGDDVVDGGAGTDMVEYTDVSAGVTVDLSVAGPENTVGAGTDSLLSIEGATGTAAADSLTGTTGIDSLFGKAGADSLFGGDGNDMLYPGTGDDAVDGGVGLDTVRYSDLTAGVTVNLATPSTGGAAGTDALVSIERATGTAYVDSLTGNALVNVLTGLGSNDTIVGLEANDTLDGGLGTDTLDGGIGTDTCKSGETKISCEK